jgi:hypothetical protein
MFTQKTENFPLVASAMSHLHEVYASLTSEQRIDLHAGYSKNYDTMRLIFQIDGLQRVILDNGGNLDDALMPVLRDMKN